MAQREPNAHVKAVLNEGNWVGGIEIDISASDIKGSTAGANAQTTSTILIPFPPVTEAGFFPSPKSSIS
jgi:hypothetical protein